MNLSVVADDQRQLAFFGQHQQQILIRQQHELTVAVAAALPSALAVGQVDAGEQAAVEPVGMALVHDEVVEVRLEPVRRPATRSPTIRLSLLATAKRCKPLRSPALIRTSPSAVIAGCTIGAAMPLVVTVTSHNCVPSAGDTLVAPFGVEQKNLRHAAEWSTRCGEL